MIAGFGQLTSDSKVMGNVGVLTLKSNVHIGLRGFSLTVLSRKGSWSCINVTTGSAFAQVICILVPIKTTQETPFVVGDILSFASSDLILVQNSLGVLKRQRVKSSINIAQYVNVGE
jgi:hypothetical protein